jgi:hypothetical protein
MKTAILAWGSVIWDPRNLRFRGKWELGGPKLKIEFSRVSKDARLTLVIDTTNGVEVPTRFAESSRPSLLDTVADLRDREGTIMRCIGFTDISGDHASVCEHSEHSYAHDIVRTWLKASDYEAAVWTALRSNYKEQQSQAFTVPHAVSYIHGLPRAPRENALEYIRNAPSEVDTPLRKALVAEHLL